MSQLLLINSKNRTRGTTSDFHLTLADGLVQGRALHMCVTGAVINRSWYSITSDNNTFQLQTVASGAVATYDLPEGYHTVTTLLAALKALLPTWTITYDKLVNKYTFQPSDPNNTYRFLFAEAPTSALLGFEAGDRPLVSRAAPLTSRIPVKLNAETCVLVHCDVPRVKDACVDNLTGANFTASDVIAVIPIDAAPFDNIVFTNPNDTHTFALSTKALNTLRIYLTDDLNRPLALPYDWTLALKITQGPGEDKAPAQLARMADYLKYLVLTSKKS